jgi:uridine phosphorylase
MYHIGLSKKSINFAKYAILPGDPARSEFISKQIDSKSQYITTNREYTSYLAYIGSDPVLICSTGIGGPSVSIAVEELAMIGIKNMIRIGTTGAIQPHINIGDIVISSSSVRLDGASSHYAPIEYPAVASFELTNSLVNSAKAFDTAFHVGISASSDTFYAGQERYGGYSQYVRKSLQGTLKEWKALNVLNFEMEASTLFVMCSVLNLRSSCICAVIANRSKAETVDKSLYENSINQCIDIVSNAIKSENIS